MDFDKYASSLGYPVETHNIETEDGYILKFFRLQKKGTTITTGLPVVYFQHGLLDSSDTSILNDEYRAPGLMMANKGYDVWFGNVRGNYYSQKHIKYNRKQEAFWDFSMQDMAEKDLPAAFIYIYSLTLQKINYVGHSQGTLIMFMALAAENKIILETIGKYIALGPVAYVNHMNSTPMNLLSKQKWLFTLFKALKKYTFMERNQIMSVDQSLVCRGLPIVCQKFLQALMDADPKIDNMKRMNYLVWHMPSGTSVKNMKHWMQLVDSGQLQQFDYGQSQNMKIYNQTTPTLFDLGQIQIPVHLFCGDTDLLADPIDAIQLHNQLTGSSNSTIRMYHMGHATFLIGQNMDFMNDVFDILSQP